MHGVALTSLISRALFNRSKASLLDKFQLAIPNF